MSKSLKNNTIKNKTLKSKKNGLNIFQKEITLKFFEILLMIKLFHWKTFSYASHKASDDLYSKINDSMDKFMEILLGKSSQRINLISQKSLKLIDLNNQNEMIEKIKEFKNYLVSLNNNNNLKTMTNSDLFNIRDEILGDLNQFLYLLSLK